jgi:hypothetical protein
MVSPDEFDPGRSMDVDGVRKDLEELIRQGFRSFSVAGFQELRYFLSCFSLGRTDIATLEDAELSAQTIREKLTRFIQDLPETHMQKSVAEAILGMDRDTIELQLQGRQMIAGKRYSPAKPVGLDAIRKKPYGQQWKLVTYLADRFIETEKATRLQAFADYSEWGMEDPLPEGVFAVVMTEDGPSTIGGAVRTPGNAPALLSDGELEAALGYRWLEYEHILSCSHDLSTLTLSTRVLIQIKTRGTRVFVHRHPTWINVGYVLPAPLVAVNTHQDSAPVDYVGRVRHSAKYPNWWIDYFDFGSSEYDDQLYLAFDHIYDNPEREVPHEIAVIPEFDGLRSFALKGYRLLGDGDTKEALNEPYVETSPARGRQHVWLLQASPDLRRYQLKDSEQWPEFKRLQEEGITLRDMASEFDYRMRDMLRVIPPSEQLDKNVD